MCHKPSTGLLTSVLILIISSSVTVSQEATPSPEFFDEIPSEIANYSDDQPLANRDYRNTRAVTTSNINSQTVNNLEVAWTFPIPGRAAFDAAASAPIIVADVVYFHDLASNVFALSLDTGEVL